MKKFISLLLVLSLVLPVLALSEEGDLIIEELVEETVLDEEGNELIYDEETGETFIISELSEEDQEKIEQLDETVDDSVDPDTLEINTNLPDDVINILLIGVDTHDPVEKDENTD